MKLRSLLLSATGLALLVTLMSGCANFRKLGQDLKFIDQTSIVSCQISNAQSFKNIRGVTFNWNQKTNEVTSGDLTEVRGIGVFGFFVEKSKHQYICAYSDRNGDGKYQRGEPAWIHSSSDGTPKALEFNSDGISRTVGTLSSEVRLHQKLNTAVNTWLDGRTPTEAKTGWDIPLALGEVANLSDSRFSTETGETAYWEPAKAPMKGGVGIYFLEKYDPNRIPVIFVYGAAGSPQDWQTFFKTFDRKRHQLWFYSYPSARRLAESGGSLNRGIQILQAHYGFKEINVVAHSMGGLVSRYAVLENWDDGNRCIKHFVTISSPMGGMKSSESGVKRAPAVIPSWRDLVPDSEFLDELFSERLKGKVPYMLLYGDKAKRSLILPPENDGTVSVASATRKEAVADAIKVQSFPEDHVSILSNSQVIKMVEDFIAD